MSWVKWSRPFTLVLVEDHSLVERRRGWSDESYARESPNDLSE